MYPAGDAAFLIEAGSEANPTNSPVLSLADFLRQTLHEVPDLDVVPAHASVLVSFRPGCLSEASLAEAVERARASRARSATRTVRALTIPTAYGGQFGPDLLSIAGLLGLTPEKVVALHTSATYRVAFLGFSPGFPYLTGLSPSLAVPRLPSPRGLVPAGSVGLGGEQTGIYPAATPGGWRIIGRTPVVLFDPSHLPPVDYQPGDVFRFTPVSAEEFDRLRLLKPSLRTYNEDL